MAGSMKDIKLRIKSVESTMQITKAMELVASSKMRRAKERVEHSRPYFETLHDTLTGIAAADPRARSPYLRRAEIKRTLLVVIAGDRGLAGGRLVHEVDDLEGTEGGLHDPAGAQRLRRPTGARGEVRGPQLVQVNVQLGHRPGRAAIRYLQHVPRAASARTMGPCNRPAPTWPPRRGCWRRWRSSPAWTRR